MRKFIYILFLEFSKIPKDHVTKLFHGDLFNGFKAEFAIDNNYQTKFHSDSKQNNPYLLIKFDKLYSFNGFVIIRRKNFGPFSIFLIIYYHYIFYLIYYDFQQNSNFIH